MRDRAALVAFAQESIARGSKSFRFASRLFDRTTRERVWLLYAWCRKCDDMADGQDHGGAMAVVDDPLERLAIIRDLTAKALEGTPTGEPAFDCLGIVAQECGLTAKMAEDVIEGFALDAADWHPRRETDLYRYCYHVAGAVGVMMAVVMGVSPDEEATLDRACDLGLAFQLANIARDIVEDAQRGRCYVPSEWGLTLRGMSAPRSAEERGVAFTALRRLLALSDDFYAFARSGISAIPRHNRRAIRIAAALYQGIGRKILRQGPNLYWQGRTFLTRPEKIRILAQTLLLPELPMRKSARDVWHDDLAHLVGVPGFPSQWHA